MTPSQEQRQLSGRPWQPEGQMNGLFLASVVGYFVVCVGAVYILRKLPWGKDWPVGGVP